MIGILRIRLASEPNATVWTDLEWQQLMNQSVQFSLAHYWRKCTFGLADLSYRLFPPVLVTDPKPMMTKEQITFDPQFRSTRVKAITQAVEDQYKPDWGTFSTLLIWVASPLDLWGSRDWDHGKGRSGVMMCDITSRFDQLCHEFGHTLDFKHPFGREGIEYNSAYDIMGNYDSAWTRPGPPNILGFPTGAFTAPNPDPVRLVGPLISAAQLSMSRYRTQLPGLFADLPANVLSSPQDIKLFALDYSIDQAPQITGAMAGILPPDPISPDYHYVLELRRNRGYDAGIQTPGVVVHGYDALLKGFYFAGVLPLSSRFGDKDLHLVSGLPGADITLRMLEVGPDDTWVRIRVGGPNYWRNFGVDITVNDVVAELQYTEWKQVEVKPCVFAEPGIHSYRYRTVSHTYKIDATSFGYEAPHYTWKLDGQTLPEPSGSLPLTIQTSVPDPVLGWQLQSREIVFNYTITGAHLDLISLAGDLAATGKFGLSIEVIVNETSPEVIKNNYPDQSVITSMRIENVQIEWDKEYYDKLRYCERVIDSVNHKHIPITIPKIPHDVLVDRLPSVIEIINSMANVNPSVANALIDHVSSISSLSRLQIIAQLKQGR